MIQLDGLHVSYGGRPVLTGLSFKADDGRVTALVGQNGAGKSTAFKVLLGLLSPDRGSAEIDGTSYAQHPTPGLALGAYLGPQNIPGTMTGRGFLKWTSDLLALSNTDVGQLLESVGLANAADRKVKGYSLGMRQRLGVAAALLGKAQNLILDEPINGLDIEGVRWLRETLLNAADEGRCVLLSSHVLSELELVANDVVIMGGGKSVRQGTMEQLRTDDTEVVVLVGEDNVRLASDLQGAGLFAQIVDGAVRVNHPSVNYVAAVAGLSTVPLHSVARSVRRLEDVYLEQAQMTSASGNSREDTEG